MPVTRLIIKMQVEISRQICEKCSYTKFHDNPPCGLLRYSTGTDIRTYRHTDRQTEPTDMTKLIFASRNFENAPKMWEIFLEVFRMGSLYSADTEVTEFSAHIFGICKVKVK